MHPRVEFACHACLALAAQAKAPEPLYSSDLGVILRPNEKYVCDWCGTLTSDPTAAPCDPELRRKVGGLRLLEAARRHGLLARRGFEALAPDLQVVVR
jgi:hypothetical protein